MTMSKMTPEMKATAEVLAIGITSILDTSLCDLPEDTRLGITMAALIACTNRQVKQVANRDPLAADLMGQAVKSNIDQVLAGQLQPISKNPLWVS